MRRLECSTPVSGLMEFRVAAGAAGDGGIRRVESSMPAAGRVGFRVEGSRRAERPSAAFDRV